MRPVDSIKQNKRLFFLMVVLDFLFLVLILYALFVFWRPAVDVMLDITKIIQGEMTTSFEKLMAFDDLLRSNPDFMSAYHTLFYLLGQFVLYVLCAWVFVKSLVWWLSHKSFLKKIRFVPYVGKFILLSLFWFLALLVCLLLSGYIGTFSQLFGTFLFICFIIVITYLSQVSFALVPSSKTFKNTFIYCFTRKRLMLAFAINVMIVVAAFGLTILLSRLSGWLGFAFLLLVALPALAFCRFHIIAAAWRK